MADTLRVLGQTFQDVTGIKAQTTGGVTLTFTRSDISVESQEQVGDWTVRVWSNGFIEAWYMGAITMTTAGASYQGWYRSVVNVTIPTEVRAITGDFADDTCVLVTGAYNAHIYTSGGIRSSGTAFEAQVLGMNALAANASTTGWSVYISGYRR